MAKQDPESNTSSRLGVSGLPMELGMDDLIDGKSDLVSVLSFEVGGEWYSIGVENTEGVVDCPKLTPLPGAPVGVVGLASVRGRMTVVMDLGLSAPVEALKQRLILVRGDAQLGLLADRIDGVVGLEPKKVLPVAHGKDKLTRERVKFGWPARSYFKSGTRRVPIIDVERLGEA